MVASTDKQMGLEALGRFLDSIDRKIASLQEDRAAINRSIDVLSESGRTEGYAVPAVTRGLFETAGGWRNLKGQQAVLRLLREKDNEWLKSSEISRLLRPQHLT